MFFWLFRRRFKDRQPELVAALDHHERSLRYVHERMRDGTLTEDDVERVSKSYRRWLDARVAMVK